MANPEKTDTNESPELQKKSMSIDVPKKAYSPAEIKKDPPSGEEGFEASIINNEVHVQKPSKEKFDISTKQGADNLALYLLLSKDNTSPNYLKNVESLLPSIKKAGEVGYKNFVNAVTTIMFEDYRREPANRGKTRGQLDRGFMDRVLQKHPILGDILYPIEKAQTPEIPKEDFDKITDTILAYSQDALDGKMTGGIASLRTLEARKFIEALSSKEISIQDILSTTGSFNKALKTALKLGGYAPGQSDIQEHLHNYQNATLGALAQILGETLADQEISIQDKAKVIETYPWAFFTSDNKPLENTAKVVKDILKKNEKIAKNGGIIGGAQGNGEVPNETSGG